MAYNKDIPKATDKIKSSQSDLLNNFQSIDTVVSVDHVTFDSASGNQGKHNTVSLPNYVGGAASPVAVADEIKLFTKAVTVGGSTITQLFVLPETGDTSTAERDITSATRANTGETTLPSGIKIKWGRSTTAANGLQTITFATAFTSIFTVMTTPANSAGTSAVNEDFEIRVYEFSATQFKVVGYLVGFAHTRAATPYTWFAVGI